MFLENSWIRMLAFIVSTFDASAASFITHQCMGIAALCHVFGSCFRLRSCKMAPGSILLPILLFFSGLQVSLPLPMEVKKEVFMSPGFVLEPGLVSNKFYYNVDFPRGHIAIKSFNGEVIDEKGTPIPLHETYLHHWVVLRYYQKIGSDIHIHQGDAPSRRPNFFAVKNSGVCDHGLIQYFGLGSETRKTETHVPDPYGIEVGNPADIPAGFEERWLINVHAIDTRGAEDKLGCTECRCDLYNATGEALPRDYIGGLVCCEDQARCRVKDAVQGVKRILYLRYTVEYVIWNPSILPVKIFILDVTDIWRKADESRGIKEQHHCMVEYQVEACPANGACSHTKTLSVHLPSGGDVVYGVGHQHSGGTGISLHGEGGRLICSSIPTYGEGSAPGNEEGYIVGMSTCYPKPGSIKVSEGETLTLMSNYSSRQLHTGVMGLFYLLVAEQNSPLVEENEFSGMHNVVLLFVFFVAAVVVAVAFALERRRKDGQGYEALT